MEFGLHWVGKVSSVTGGIGRENNAASSGGDWESGDGIDVDRVPHSND